MYTRKKGNLIFVSILILLTSVVCNAPPYSSAEKQPTPIPPTLSLIPTFTSTPTPEDTPVPSCDESENGDEIVYDEFDRPILYGEELPIDTEHFRIHYTLCGRDAVLSTGFIDEITMALEYSWQMEIEEYGWQAPPTDNGIGGDDKYDVYLLALEDITGDTAHVESDTLDYCTFPSNSPGTSSYMVLDSTFDTYQSERDDKLLEWVRGTIAHELNHAIQFGYDWFEPYGFLWEATAAWMEDEVYDDYNTSGDWNLDIFKSPDTCQLAEGGIERVEDEFHWYGEYLYLRYISEKHGSETIRSIWEHTIEFDVYDAIAAALAEKNTSLEDTIRGFSLALLTHNFEEGESYPTVRLEGLAHVDSTFIPNDGVGQMAADYIEIQASQEQTVDIQLNADDLQGILVGVRDQEAMIFDMPTNQLTVDMSSFENLYLVVINPAQAFREYRCEKTPYTVDVKSSTRSVPDLNFQKQHVPFFHIPKVEALMDPEEYWGEGKEFPFKAPREWFPYYIPEGYELTDEREITTEEYEIEFNSEAVWSIPGADKAVLIDFWGKCNDFNFFILISDSPYGSLDGWYADTDYTPYSDEIYFFDGIQVYSASWTDDNRPYSILTFITDRKFIVIEGTLSQEDITKVFESLFE